MSKLDRLSSLLDHFRLRAEPVPLSASNLAAFHDRDTKQKLLEFTPRNKGIDPKGREILFSLHIDFGSETNPLRTALPHQVLEHIVADDDLENLISLLSLEHNANRCGSGAVLSRLGEVLVVRILRLQIDRGATTPGLLAGLANPRISTAIVAMHEKPGKPWQNADLAAVAGLSHSRFKQLFSSLVGETPAGYLRRWRLMLARMDIERGERVDRVANRYGYKAPDAFSRAYRKQFGTRPKVTAIATR
ncbi:AraC family transcriptional regulator [Maritalea sp.]|uniref:helix-turn-helix transcriptional regulator n=1 Tax=Maritalea sp. TaxID=2003361 RepID=UPI003EF38237